MQSDERPAHSYDFHKILTAGIVLPPGSRRLTDLENYFRSYEVKNLITEPEVIFEIGDYEPSPPSDSASFDRMVIVGKGYVSYRDTDGTTSWVLEASESSGGGIRARFCQKGGGFDRLLARNLFAVAFGFRPLLEVCMSNRNWASLHGLGLRTSSDQGLLLVAPGGFGKTTIAMKAILDSGWRYLGDERVLVGQKSLRSMLVQTGLFEWKIRNLGQEWISGAKKYPAFVRMMLQARRSNCAEGQTATKSHSSENAPLSNVVILSHSNLQSPKIEEISAEEAVASAVWNTYGEFLRTYVYMIPSKSKPSLFRPIAASAMINEKSLFGGHLERLERICMDSFPSSCFRLTLPKSELDASRILKLLRDIGV